MRLTSIRTGQGRALVAAAAICLSLCACGSGKNALPEQPQNRGQSVNGVSSDAAVTDTGDHSDPIGRLAGKFCIDGDSSASSVVIESDGTFTAYYASGTVEQRGTVRYETDDTSGRSLHVYVFYTDEGKPYMGFVDSGEAPISEFETGNGSNRFVRVTD